jgi:adhesin/invasin
MRSIRLAHQAAAATLLVAALLAGCSSAIDSGAGAATTITSTGATDLSGVVGTVIGPFVFVVTDANNNVVPGVPVTFTISGAATLNTTTATTDNGGSVITTATYAHATGTATITATANGVSTPATVSTISVADAPTQIVALAGSGQTSQVGTPLSEPLIVRITDQYDNPVSGILVSWTSDGGTFGVAAARTGADGRVTNTFTPTHKGSITLAATTTYGGASLTATGN